MVRMNVLLVLRHDGQAILMCKRNKPPYKGLYNLVGGKVEPGETEEDAAYRELREETGITRADIRLVPLIDFIYYLEDCRLTSYAGRLAQPVEVRGEENPLLWVSVEENFFDMTRFAGLGNIGHMLAIARAHLGDIVPPPTDGVVHRP